MGGKVVGSDGAIRTDGEQVGRNHPLPVDTMDVETALARMLVELRIMNKHLAGLKGIELTEDDL